MDEQQKQTILDIPKVIAVGIASPVATILTSRFGVAGTLIGLALSAVILTALADMLKVYLARAPATVAKVPTTVVKVPGGLRARLSWRNVRDKLKAAFSRFSSLPPASARRRSILISSLAAAGISFVVGLIVVTVLELGVGKSLSCWVWDECSTEESSADGSESAQVSTLPSVLGGGQRASSSTLQVEEVSPSEVIPSGPQEQPASQAADVPATQEAPDPSPSAQPGQRQGPSGPVEADQQQVPSGGGAPAGQQQSPTDEPEGQ